MKKTVTAFVAAASIAAAAVATSSTAEARYGWGWGPAVVGGLAAGAIIGGALAARPYYYPYGYYGYAPSPYYGRPCVWRRVWTAYGWRRACV